MSNTEKIKLPNDLSLKEINFLSNFLPKEVLDSPLPAHVIYRYAAEVAFNDNLQGPHVKVLQKLCKAFTEGRGFARGTAEFEAYLIPTPALPPKSLDQNNLALMFCTMWGYTNGIDPQVMTMAKGMASVAIEYCTGKETDAS